MKAIIIAAGLGSRLKHHTENIPKCMLPIMNKPMIEYQIEALNANGIHDIAIVKGYMREKIDYPDYKEFINTDYFNNNILCSLMYAQSFMDDDIIISYSDILYDKTTIAHLMKSQEDISIVVDKNWQHKYVDRDSHPKSEAENVQYDPRLHALQLGKGMDSNLPNIGEFIGLLKLSPRGCAIFKEEFRKAQENYEGKPFSNAPVFEKAYITDFLNYLISQQYYVYCILISDGWREIDTEQDLKNAELWINQARI